MFYAGYKVVTSGLTDAGTVGSNNEDSFLFYNLEADQKIAATGAESSTVGKSILILMSDGMGGANAGEVASKMAIDEILNHIRANCPAKPFKSVKETSSMITESINHAHACILKASKEHSDRSGMGATITCVMISKNKVWIAQVGDSRLYTLNQLTIKQLTEDQTPVARLVKDGELSESEARKHPKRNLLDQALGGGLDEIIPVLSTNTIDTNTCLLLCTDGLTDALEDSNIHTIITKNTEWNLPSACRYLVSDANTQYGEDNVTVALCKITDKI